MTGYSVSEYIRNRRLYLAALDIKENAKVIDVGTGAGFPGVVLLIARPDLRVTLMDGTNKRLNFISDVLEEFADKGFHPIADDRNWILT